MESYWPTILSAAITVVLNAVFLFLVQSSVNSSLEKYKISYSGVFKEKIDIYKSLLGEVHDLKYRLNLFQLTDSKSNDIKARFYTLIRLYSVNRPFLSDKLVDLFKKHTVEMQSIFEAFAMDKVPINANVPEETVRKIHEDYKAAVEKLRDKNALGAIEEEIIREMRVDLATDEISLSTN